MHDVAIGQNEAIRRDNKTGAAASYFAWASPTVESLSDVDVNNGRTDTIGRAYDRARVLIEQSRVIGSGRDSRRFKFLACFGFV